jgi:C-terminal processing protease CtpA/Prc
MEARLTNRSNEPRGSIIASRVNGEAIPPANYPALVDKALALSREYLYDPAIFRKKSWRKFEKTIRRKATAIQDDMELAFTFYYYAARLPFSHYSLLRMPVTEEQQITASMPAITLEEKTPQTALMNIRAFDGAKEEVDSIIRIVLAKKYANLIIDLSRNRGGHVGPGLRLAQYVTDNSFYGGILLTQKWFRTHSALPQPKDYASLPHFSEANYDLIIKGIHEQQGLCLKVTPMPQQYKGRLFIITSGITASTCEPIVYGLKYTKRATIVGKQTAGAMLNGEHFDAGEGYSLFLPTADYYTVDGFRIDRQGVKPDYETEPSKAVEYILQNLIK